jgi:hypothetical protein
MTPHNVRYMAHRINQGPFHNGQRSSRGSAIGLLFGSMRALGCYRQPRVIQRQIGEPGRLCDIDPGKDFCRRAVRVGLEARQEFP